jgi:predicted transcriptional regulator
LNIPQSTVKSIIKKLKEYGTIKIPVKRELQSSTVEIGVSVHRTTLSRTLHRAGFYRRVSRKKSHCLREKNKQKRLVFAKRCMRDWKKGRRRRYSMEEGTLVR